MSLVDEKVSLICSEKQNVWVANSVIKAFLSEVSKGCTGTVYKHPIASLAPDFDEFLLQRLHGYEEVIYPDPKPASFTNYLTLEFNFHYGFEATEGMTFLQQFQTLKHPLFWDIEKSGDVLRYFLHVEHCDFKRLQSALSSSFPNITFTQSEHQEPIPNVSKMFYPNPPYHRSFNVPVSLSSVLANIHIPKGDKFKLRMVIEKAPQNWAQNIAILQAWEKSIYNLLKDTDIIDGWYFPKSESESSILKLKQTSPHFFVLPLTFYSGMECENIESLLGSLKHGGNSLNSKSYKLHVDKQIYSHGFLTSIEELEPLLCLPDEKTLEVAKEKFNIGFSLPEKVSPTGSFLGSWNNEKIFLPKKDWEYSLGILGKQGLGKSNVLLQALKSVVQDPNQSLILFYFHDLDFIQSLTSVIPDSRLKDVIIASPTLDGKILGQNLVSVNPFENALRKSSHLVKALETGTTSFGVDVKFVMSALFGILTHLTDVSFSRCLNIINPNDPVGKNLRAKAKRIITNEILLDFIDSIERRPQESNKIHNKLQSFLLDSEIAEMCSYAGNDLFTLEEVVKEKKILIMHFAGLGESGDVLASFYSSMIHEYFQSFSNKKGKQFYPTVFAIDEVQRVKSADAILKSLRENRKFGLRFALATQTLRGCSRELQDSFELVGTLCSYQVPEYDAKLFSVLSGGTIRCSDLMELPPYEMYVKLGSSKGIAKLKTEKFIEGNKKNLSTCIQQSLKNYYLDFATVKKEKISNEKKIFEGGRPKAIPTDIELPTSLTNLSKE